MRAHRPGFSLIELMIVVLLVGILARIAVPSLHRYIYMARATAVLSEIQAVRVAAYAYHSDNHHWPADVNRGIVPPGLQPYLGADFTFVRDGYMLDWDNWVLPDGSPQYEETGVLVGVSLTTTDERFGTALVDVLGNGVAKATIGEHYTFVVVAAD